MKGLSKEFGTAVMLITHDLGVVAGTCQHVNVMYAGHVVESAPVKQIFETPAHPYTVGLLESIPRLDEKRGARLTPIAGQPPDLLRPPVGCPYAPRCPKVQNRCRQERPELMPVGRGEQVAACFYPN
jgi:oligopeptide transport system ATP-binding protein